MTSLSLGDNRLTGEVDCEVPFHSFHVSIVPQQSYTIERVTNVWG